jgi:hypothetical protein
MDKTPGVGIQRSDLLRRPARLDFFHQEARHLAQFRILVLAEAECIDHVMTLAAGVAPEHRIDDDLQGVERLALAPEQYVRAFARDVQPGVIRHFLDGHLEAQAHRAKDLLEELNDLRVEICAHGALPA